MGVCVCACVCATQGWILQNIPLKLLHADATLRGLQNYVKKGRDKACSTWRIGTRMRWMSLTSCVHVKRCSKLSDNNLHRSSISQMHVGEDWSGQTCSLEPPSWWNKNSCRANEVGFLYVCCTHLVIKYLFAPVLGNKDINNIQKWKQVYYLNQGWAII